MSVLAIDPGLRHLGYCYAEANGIIREWHVSSICPPSVRNASKVPLHSICGFVRAWCEDHWDLIVRADTVIVEHQLKNRFILIEGLILGYAGKKALPLSAAVYKKALGLCRGSHAANKAAVVAWIHEQGLGPIPNLGPGVKKDDLADARAMVHYWQNLRGRGKRSRTGSSLPPALSLPITCNPFTPDPEPPKMNPPESKSNP